MTDHSDSATGNLILDRLPAAERERLAPHLERVRFRLSEVLFHPGDRLEHVYFPTTTIVSLLTKLSNGQGMEVGLVGREGVAGISVVLGGQETKVATAQAAGEAVRVEAGVVRAEFARRGEFQRRLLHYTHALLSQVSQSVVCNARHQIPGRLARWLLMYHDRIGRDEFELTHEFMANMLGVRRAGVSEAAEELQRLGMISYHRGRVVILDRERLEAFVCECYDTVKEKYRELFLWPEA